MSIARSALLLLVAATAAPLAAQDSLPRTPVGVTVLIQTIYGEIEAVIDTVHAPITGRNFLRYVDDSLFRNSRFHRTVTKASPRNTPIPIEVIQGSRDPQARGGFPAIPLERTRETGLRHLDGTLSMARSGPDTGTSQYFICIGPQPELDFGGKRQADGQGFAAFGQVVRGMEVVRKIHQLPADAQENLTPAVVVTNIIRKR